jgi:acetolactate synthase-1/2/3 large subunit
MSETSTTPATGGPAGTGAAHGGEHAVAVAAAHGADTLFTLSGAHVFPMYDAAVHADPPMRILDVRHEQTAVFAAEAVGKLTRVPGLAVLTAGPGVTNGVSAVTQVRFSGSPPVVVGGRAPASRWGTGSLQELDHPPLLASVTKLARTVHEVHEIAGAVDEAFTLAGTSHRGPVFLDVPMDRLFDETTLARPAVRPRRPVEPDDGFLALVGSLLAGASRPVLVLGTDVWADGAEEAALRFVEQTGVPVVTNGMGRGVVPGGHPLLVTKARGTAFGTCDLAVVVGTPLDFRLGYGVFGGKHGAPPARVVHLADSPGQVSRHAELAASASGDLTLVLDGVLAAVERQPHRPDRSGWVGDLRDAMAAAVRRDTELLRSEADPIHPARVYGGAGAPPRRRRGGDRRRRRLRVVRRQVPRAEAARVARPSAQVVLLLGDGAAGLSLMDVDTLVRHDLPVAMVCGNNSAWGLEKHPMQTLYGYDVAADLAPRTRYDEVVRALGGGGETVTDPAEIGPALDRALAAGTPYLVNVVTDVEAAYPRATFGV